MIQRLQTLFDDDQAVSSVIGVVLMVGVTVVLASTVGTFALDFGNTLNDPTPTAIFDVEENKLEYSDGSDTAKFTEIELMFMGGQQIDTSRIQVLIDSEQAYARGDEMTTGGNDVYQVAKPFGDKDVITAGATARIWSKTETYDTDYWSEGKSATDDPYFSATSSEDLVMDTDNSDGNPSPTENLDLESGELVRIIYETRQGNENILFEYEIE